MNEEPTAWHLVLSRDGTVLGAADGAPPDWVSRRLDQCDDAPDDLKEAGRTILSRASEPSRSVSAMVPLAPRHPSVLVTVVDAVPLRRVPVDLRALLGSSLQVMHQQAEACDITLDMVLDDHVPPFVCLDPMKIAWAVTALVGNALRYVRRGSRGMPGGSITVRAGYRAQAAEIVLEVEDDGPGIPREQRALVLGGTGDRSRAGVGLWMVREVVAAHGGVVDIESETGAFGHGTTIRLTLPVS